MVMGHLYLTDIGLTKPKLDDTRLGYTPGWAVTKFASNPIIDVTGSGDRANETYQPSPFRIGATYYCIVKGNKQLWLYSSTAPDGTWTVVGAAAVIAEGGSGTWDEHHARPGVACYDGTSTVYIFYGGQNAAESTGGIGLATATVTGETIGAFAKDAGNPLITNSAIQTALGISNVRTIDPSDLIKIGSTYYLFFTYYLSTTPSGGTEGIAYATATALAGPWTVAGTPVVTQGQVALDYGATTPIGIQHLNIFRYNGLYYGVGTVQIAADNREIRLWLVSDDCIPPWRRLRNTLILAKGSGSGFEDDRVYAGAFLKKQDGNWVELERVGASYWYFYSGYQASDVDASTCVASFTDVPAVSDARIGPQERIIPLELKEQTLTNTTYAFLGTRVDFLCPPSWQEGTKCRVAALLKNSGAGNSTFVRILPQDSTGTALTVPAADEISSNTTDYVLVTSAQFTLPAGSRWLSVQARVGSGTGTVLGIVMFVEE